MGRRRIQGRGEGKRREGHVFRDLVRQRNEIKEESDEEKAESRRPSTSSSRKTFRIGESSSATVLFKEQKKDMAKQKLSPKYMGTPSTSDGTRWAREIHENWAI